MSRIAVAALVLGVATVAGPLGCASGHTVFNTKASLEGTEPIKKLFVMSHARSKHFGGAVYQAFEANMKAGLTACGVESEMLSPDEMALDVKPQIEATLGHLKPDAALVVRRAGGSVSSGSGGSNNSLIFDLEVQDLRAKKAIWKAKSTFSFLTNNMFTSDESTGKELATGLIGQMAKDGVLKGCPPPPAQN
jgi:hypothetical protein